MPGRRGGEAWHIGIDGAAAYDRRFRRAFGFYEGRAAAVAPDGWRHLRVTVPKSANVGLIQHIAAHNWVKMG